MQNVVRITIALCLFIGLGSTFANEATETATGSNLETGFTEQERQLIRIYMGMQTDKLTRPGIVFNKATLKKKQEQGLPAGLIEKKSLPPGLAAQLQRNNTLPPGLAKSKLPLNLEQQLSPLREGYERSMLDDLTVVLIETATNRIADIVAGPKDKADLPGNK